MPTPLAEMLPQIVTLNVADQPFSYYAEGIQILGWWDMAKVSALYPTQEDQADQTYRLTVTLNQANGTFNYNETRRSAPFGAAGYDDSGFKTSGMTWSSGKRITKDFSFTLGGKAGDTNPEDEQEDKDSPYVFREDRIKAHLFEWLHAHGWNHQNAVGRFFAP
ncbi:hypothetical protein [Nocardioides sp. YR527]|uniref:hypothetical protein n=1 Tax=Nocardioides sp. YR527 TaxID=1881028 RepID=UPI00115FD357|nr:hypothetical protein [Nocardioides sp. YR527]